MIVGMSQFNLFKQPDATLSIVVDPTEAARLLGISRRVLWSLTNRGEIPSFKVGKLVRYRRDDLERWTREKLEMSRSAAVRDNGQHH